MTESDKAAQRSILIYQLGKLLAPVSDLAERSTPPPASEYFIVAARCLPDKDKWAAEVVQFTTFGEYRMDGLASDITKHAHNLLHHLKDWAQPPLDDAGRQAHLRTQLEGCRQATLATIDRVPIEWASHLHEAKTPFSVYLRIRDAIGTAKRRVHYFDRYLNTDFFDVYMRNLGRSLEVRLVTTRGNAGYGVLNVQNVSRLAAGEFARYELIQCDTSYLHDRNLRIDDLIFFLGPSIKDAGEC